MDAAKRELAEKAGLEAALEYRGNVYIRALRSKETDRHMLVQLFEAHNLRESHQGMLRHDTSESFWAHLDSLEPEMFMPGFYEIARLASSQGMLLKDLQIKSPFDASGDL